MKIAYVFEKFCLPEPLACEMLAKACNITQAEIVGSFWLLCSAAIKQRSLNLHKDDILSCVRPILFELLEHLELITVEEDNVYLIFCETFFYRQMEKVKRAKFAKTKTSSKNLGRPRKVNK